MTAEGSPVEQRTINESLPALASGARRPKAVPDQSVSKLGVIGAGRMGASIALVAARAGIPVVLVDQTLEAATKGKAYSGTFAAKSVARGQMEPSNAQSLEALITPSDSFSDLSGCDLIIESVFEDPDIKGHVIKALDDVAHPDAILATNTSTLPIAGLAKSTRDPSRFIGTHFFLTVEKMPLVEIIPGTQTADRALAKALDFTAQIRKVPIVVGDQRYFYANRCIIAFVHEGLRMVSEGVPLPQIEQAAKDAGMPIGPLQLADEIALDLVARIARVSQASMDGAYADGDLHELIFWMEDQGRLGKKARSGFYNYAASGGRQGLSAAVAKRFTVDGQTAVPTKDLQDRLWFVQILEAVRTFEEGVLSDVREGDVGAILGWGFPQNTGGPFSWIDGVGADKIAQRCMALQETYGKRFACPEKIKMMAKDDTKFYL